MSSSTTQAPLSTPTKSPATPVADSPGNWRHPRLQEISRRREKTTFTEKNVKRITLNVTILIAIIAMHTFLSRILPSRRSFPYAVWSYARYLYWALLSIPTFNIGFNFLPLFRPKDNMSDIPLTPGQRRLLGLPPTSAAPTPGSVYSTPPRYSRTPSISGSAGSRRSFSSSPISNRSPSNFGSPANGSGSGSGNFSVFASPGSPLLQKAMNGARRSSFGSLGPPSPLGASTGSFFGGGPETPSPSPAMGKRSTVGLNSKWLYEKGRDRRTSSNAWLYT